MIIIISDKVKKQGLPGEIFKLNPDQNPDGEFFKIPHGQNTASSLLPSLRYTSSPPFIHVFAASSWQKQKRSEVGVTPTSDF